MSLFDTESPRWQTQYTKEIIAAICRDCPRPHDGICPRMTVDVGYTDHRWYCHSRQTVDSLTRMGRGKPRKKFAGEA